MEIERFKDGAPGRLVTAAGGLGSAFLPAPLPAEMEISYRVFDAHGDAALAIGRVAEGLPRKHFDPYLLVHPLVQREALFTSRMENTYTTPREMVLFADDEGEGDDGMRGTETREVVNYVRAANEVFRLIRERREQADHIRPISHEMICGAHAVLMKGVRGQDKNPGRYRTEQNFIGKPSDTLRTARYVPPPPESVQGLMDDLVAYCCLPGPESGFPLLARLAHIHYQFEAIHPFTDGNGRIGRLLIPLLLCSTGKLAAPLIHVSAILERRQDEYRDLMLAVSTDGAWEPWTVFFLDVLREAAESTLTKMNALFELRERYIGLATSPRSPSLLRELIGEIMKRGSITIKRATEILGVTPAVAGKHVRRLESMGIVTEVTGRKKNLRFVAFEVLEVVFSP